MNERRSNAPERESLVSERVTKERNSFKTRSRLEIVSSLLIRARNGALKTHLMYGANLNHPLLQEYLAILLETRLIAIDHDADDQSIRYRTTTRGLEFLQHYMMIVELLGDRNALTKGSYHFESELRSEIRKTASKN